MKRNFSTKFVWTLSLIVMFLWLASNGCSKGRIADQPSDQTSSAQIDVSSSQIAYGNVGLNSSKDQTISVQNTGSSGLNIGQIAQAKPLAPPFSIVSDACSGQAVQPSAECSFKVRFSPTSQGTFTDSFDIPSDASNDNSMTIDITGSGIATTAQINVSSSQIAYGNVVLNNMTDQTVSIQNTGSISLNIGQIAQANPLGLPFSIVNDACSGQAVLPSAECTFKVQFSPTSQGTFTDSFDIPSDASNENSVTVDVTGSGKALRVAIDKVITTSCSTGVLELIVNVTDQNNNPLAGLVAGDFQLKENGVQQAISSLSTVSTPVPISVAMVLDYTTSIQSQIPTIEAASKVFVGMLTVNDEASIIKFAQMQQEMCSFTSDTTVLTTAINTAPTPSLIGRQDETRLYDAIWFAAGKTAVRLNHKALVLVTDGVDISYLGVPNVSVKTLDEVIAYAKGNDVAIYTVGLGNVDGGVMNRLASETGGQYYYITDASQLSGVYQAISDILFGQYDIKYVSSLHGSSPIMLEIDVLGGADEGVGASQVIGCP